MATMIGAVMMLCRGQRCGAGTIVWRGKAAACEELGNRLQEGSACGATRPAPRSCSAGVQGEECGRLRRRRARARSGEGQPADRAWRSRAWKKLCKQGSARACANLGDLFCAAWARTGFRPPEPCWQHACEQGQRARRARGWRRSRSRRRLDRADQLACRLRSGRPVRCSYLETTYARSNDTVRAILFFRRACEADSRTCAGQAICCLTAERIRRRPASCSKRVARRRTRTPACGPKLK